jgi:hypothetical protein
MSNVHYVWPDPGVEVPDLGETHTIPSTKQESELDRRRASRLAFSDGFGRIRE